MLRFDGRVAIVTGAAGNPGLGRSYSLLLASRGARVVVNDLGGGPDGRGIAPVDPADVVREIRDLGGEAVVDRNSVAGRESAEAVVKTALDTWGRVDILINNAGVNLSALFSEITPSDIERTIGVHLLGTVWMCHAVWPHMRDRGYGRILNISSSSALGQRFLAIYGAAKGGVLGLTRSLAIEGASHGISVNSLSPGAGTASAQYISDPADTWVRDVFSQATPEQVAPAAAFLAHEECLVTGRHLQAAAGHVNELYFAQTAGYANPSLSVEDVRDQFASILDRGTGTPVDDPLEADAASPFRPKPYVASDEA